MQWIEWNGCTCCFRRGRGIHGRNTDTVVVLVGENRLSPLQQHNWRRDVGCHFLIVIVVTAGDWNGMRREIRIFWHRCRRQIPYTTNPTITCAPVIIHLCRKERQQKYFYLSERGERRNSVPLVMVVPMSVTLRHPSLRDRIVTPFRLSNIYIRSLFRYFSQLPLTGTDYRLQAVDTIAPE